MASTDPRQGNPQAADGSPSAGQPDGQAAAGYPSGPEGSPGQGGVTGPDDPDGSAGQGGVTDPDGSAAAKAGVTGPDGSAAPAGRVGRIGHEHRDVSGGWLRPSVFGAMDGLVTNVSLISGVGGGGLSQHTIVLTGLAGLAAGAFSMAAGEYVSVSSQNELVAAEVEKERYELETNPESERYELAAMYRMRGVDADVADKFVRQLSRHPDQTLRVHVREELGVDHEELPSPFTAAGASLLTFAIGALIPLLPFLFGFDSLAAALVLAAVAAFVGGGMVARITARPFWRGAVRQLVLAVIAAGLTYFIGSLVGGRV
jgi:vacuolar iron transporter family protein